MKFAKRLQELKEKGGISNYRIAKEANVSQTTVARWLSGESLPGGANVNALSTFFGVSTDYLLGNTPDAEKAPGQMTEREEIDEEILSIYASMTPAERRVALTFAKHLVDIRRQSEQGGRQTDNDA